MAALYHLIVRHITNAFITNCPNFVHGAPRQHKLVTGHMRPLQAHAAVQRDTAARGPKARLWHCTIGCDSTTLTKEMHMAGLRGCLERQSKTKRDRGGPT